MPKPTPEIAPMTRFTLGEHARSEAALHPASSRGSTIQDFESQEQYGSFAASSLQMPSHLPEQQ